MKKVVALSLCLIALAICWLLASKSRTRPIPGTSHLATPSEATQANPPPSPQTGPVAPVAERDKSPATAIKLPKGLERELKGFRNVFSVGLMQRGVPPPATRKVAQLLARIRLEQLVREASLARIDASTENSLSVTIAPYDGSDLRRAAQDALNGLGANAASSEACQVFLNSQFEGFGDVAKQITIQRKITDGKILYSISQKTQGNGYGFTGQSLLDSTNLADYVVLIGAFMHP